MFLVIACVSAFSSFASDVAVVAKPPLPSISASILRPLAESLSTEQDAATQTVAALCLAAAIDSSPAPDPAQIAKFLSKWIKLLKSDGFGSLRSHISSSASFGLSSSVFPPTNLGTVPPV